MTWSLRLYLCQCSNNAATNISQTCFVQMMWCCHYPNKTKSYFIPWDTSDADAWCIRPSHISFLKISFGLMFDPFQSQAAEALNWYLSFLSFMLELWLILDTFKKQTKQYRCMFSVTGLGKLHAYFWEKLKLHDICLKDRTDGNISCQQLNNWHETWTL